MRDHWLSGRVSPHERAWPPARRNGERVLATGDGFNDGAALRAADVGVAMGEGGTDTARQAAGETTPWFPADHSRCVLAILGLVLTDDAFETVVVAVREGRKMLDNLVSATSFMIGPPSHCAVRSRPFASTWRASSLWCCCSWCPSSLRIPCRWPPSTSFSSRHSWSVCGLPSGSVVLSCGLCSGSWRVRCVHCRSGR